MKIHTNALSIALILATTAGGALALEPKGTEFPRSICDVDLPTIAAQEQAEAAGAAPTKIQLTWTRKERKTNNIR